MTEPMQLSAVSKGCLEVFDVAEGQLALRLTKPDVIAAYYAPDGSRLAALLPQNQVCVLELPSFKEQWSVTLDFEPEVTLWTRDGSQLAFALNSSSDAPNFCLVDARPGAGSVICRRKFRFGNLDCPLLQQVGASGVLALASGALHFFCAGAADAPEFSVEHAGLSCAFLAPASTLAATYVLCFTKRCNEVTLLAVDLERRAKRVMYQSGEQRIDELDAIWAPDALICAYKYSVRVDNTNKDYYGSSALATLTVVDAELVRHANVTPANQGHVRLFAWLPGQLLLVGAKEFPCKINVYDPARRRFLFTLGVLRRNFVTVGAQFCLIGGIGNLPGDCEIWTATQPFECVGHARLSCATAVQLSPDGRYVLSATTSPRLMQDNCISLLKWNGEPLSTRAYGELFDVAWRPMRGCASFAVPRAEIRVRTAPEPQKSLKAISMNMLLENCYTAPDEQCKYYNVAQKFEPEKPAPPAAHAGIALPVGLPEDAVGARNKKKKQPAASKPAKPAFVIQEPA